MGHIHSSIISFCLRFKSRFHTEFATGVRLCGLMLISIDKFYDLSLKYLDKTLLQKIFKTKISTQSSNHKNNTIRSLTVPNIFSQTENFTLCRQPGGWCNKFQVCTARLALNLINIHIYPASSGTSQWTGSLHGESYKRLMKK